MQKNIKFLGVLALLVLLNFVASSKKAVAQIVIDSHRPIAGDDILAVKPAFAFRKIPRDAIVASNADAGEWLITSDVLLNSLKNNTNISSLDQNKIKVALQEAREKDTATKDALGSVLRSYSMASKQPPSQGGVMQVASVNRPPDIITYEPSYLKPNQSVDAEAIQNILKYGRAHSSAGATASGALIVASSGTVKGIALDRQFAISLMNLYETLDLNERRDFDSVGSVSLAKAVEFAASDERLASTTLVSIGNATFGKPLAFTAGERKLIIEPSISRHYDVYWVEFALSPGDDFASRSTELFFSVVLNDPSSIALELVPLRYGTNSKVTTNLQSPDVSVEAAGNRISVGKVYEQTIEYSYLKPTILATGLRDSSFGWIMKDDMVDASSKRLIAIVGFPKGTKRVAMTLSLSGHIRNWNPFQSSRSSTQPLAYTLSLVD